MATIVEVEMEVKDNSIQSHVQTVVNKILFLSNQEAIVQFSVATASEKSAVSKDNIL